MIDLEVGAGSSGAGTELQHATGVGRDDCFAAGCGDRLHFFLEQMLRHAAVSDIVDAGAAAAAVGALHLDEFQDRESLAAIFAVGCERVGRGRDGRDPGRSRSFPAERSSPTKPRSARNSPASLTREAEALGLLAIVGVVAQQVTIFFHRRAAARGVDDNRIDIGSREKRRYCAGPSLWRQSSRRCAR